MATASRCRRCSVLAPKPPVVSMMKGMKSRLLSSHLLSYLFYLSPVILLSAAAAPRLCLRPTDRNGEMIETGCVCEQDGSLLGKWHPGHSPYLRRPDGHMSYNFGAQEKRGCLVRYSKAFRKTAEDIVSPRCGIGKAIVHIALCSAVAAVMTVLKRRPAFWRRALRCCGFLEARRSCRATDLSGEKIVFHLIKAKDVHRLGASNDEVRMSCSCKVTDWTADPMNTDMAGMPRECSNLQNEGSN